MNFNIFGTNDDLLTAVLLIALLMFMNWVVVPASRGFMEWARDILDKEGSLLDVACYRWYRISRSCHNIVKRSKDNKEYAEANKLAIRGVRAVGKEADKTYREIKHLQSKGANRTEFSWEEL